MRAADALAALRAAQQFGRPFPLVLTDGQMPRMDGYEFMERVKQIPALQSVPSIAMTGFGMDRDIEKAKAVGYNAHLVKPVDIAELCALIEKFTAQGTTLPL